MSKSGSVLFCCSSNAVSGFGHFSRCLNLARWIRSIDPSVTVSFLGNYAEFAEKMLAAYQIQYQQVTEEQFTDIGFITDRVAGHTRIIFDSYLYDQHFINTMCALKSRTIMIDDFNAHDLSRADLIINFTINAEHLHYHNTRTALGPRYFIAKPELQQVREHNQQKQQSTISDILLFLGGSFSDEAALRTIVEAVSSQVTHATVNVISGVYSFPHKEQSGTNTVICTTPVDAIETYYAAADLCITGGGLSKYESAYCGIPCGVISLNEEQHRETISFEAHGLCYDLGLIEQLDPEKLKAGIKTLITDDQIRQRMAARTLAVFHSDSAGSAARKVLALS